MPARLPAATRILAFDVATGEPSGEYVYEFEDINDFDVSEFDADGNTVGTGKTSDIFVISVPEI